MYSVMVIHLPMYEELVEKTQCNSCDSIFFAQSSTQHQNQRQDEPTCMCVCV